MPEAFEKCRRNGGRIRTISGPNKMFKLEAGEYRHVCWLNNEPYWGEKHTKKTDQKSK